MKSETILIASGKGGVGKSTITTNLASTFAENGHKVCIIDLDLNLGKLDILLGLESKVENNMSDILLRNTGVVDTLIQYNNNENLYLLPASRNIDDITINSKQLHDIISQLKENMFEYIFLDCPAGVDKLNPFRAATRCADRALIITNPEKTSLRDADVAISILENQNFNSDNKLHLIINKYLEPKLLSKKKFIGYKEIEKTLAIPLLYVFKHDNKYLSYLNSGEPGIYKNNKLASDFHELYKKLYVMKEEDSSKKNKINNIFNKFKKA